MTEPPPATQMRQQGRRYDLTPLLVLPLAARKPVKHAWRKSHHGRPTGRTGSMEELQMTLATAATSPAQADDYPSKPVRVIGSEFRRVRF
ncbi:MAG: hypothetical protein WBE90_00785 [Xanthobacteraceae bacterium]